MLSLSEERLNQNEGSTRDSNERHLSGFETPDDLLSRASILLVARC